MQRDDSDAALLQYLGLKPMEGEEPMRAVGECSGGCATKASA